MKTKKLYIALLAGLFVTSLVQAQIPSYVPTSGLQAWWGFNGNANDLSGNANNATNNGATFIADRNGNAGAAASFNGTTNYMVITTPGFSFSPSGAFTYSFWMNKQTNTGGNIALMSGTSTTGVFITLVQGSTQVAYGTNKQQSSWVNITCPHTLNVWDHYITTFNAGIMKLYKNGVFQSTGTYSYTGATTATIPFYIGRGIATSGGNYKGGIDDIGIWNRELSQTEINDLFNSITTVSDVKANSDLMVYPNPAKDVIQLKTNRNQLGLNYRIVDAQGRTVETGKILNESTSIDIKSFAAGVYFIEMGEENGRNNKFIKRDE